MARVLAGRLRHVHMTDGTGSAKDEHLVPGRGTQPVVELLEHLAGERFEGHIVLEINTRKASDREARELDLVEALAFTRLNFAAAPDPDEQAAGQAQRWPGHPRPDPPGGPELLCPQGFRRYDDPRGGH